MNRPSDEVFVPPSDVRQIPGSPRPKGSRSGLWAVLATVGAVLLKFKFIFVALKFGKFFGTIASMGLMIVVYAKMFGWWYGAGFVLLIAVHEMGHVLAARRVGLKTSAPIFIPFVGAFIAMKQQPTNARIEAIVAFGGPWVGSAGAALCMVAGIALDNRLLLALAYTGFFLNLFNLVPIHPLDGGRIVTAISPWLWLIGIPALGALLIWHFNPIVLLMLLLGMFQAWRVWKSPDRTYFQVPPAVRVQFAVYYFGLMALLGVGMAWIHGLHVGLGAP
jgi:Zn-dependent protease